MYGVVPASKIIGEMVVNRQSENVGKIIELVIDAKKNRILYAVLSFGGFMGVGNKLFAMPWEAFEFSATENKLILNVDKEKLKTAPGFEKGDNWPDFENTIWGESIYNYYDYTPPWKSQE
jgi:sporulation protein YlmC with PRC-barrel domain